MAVSFVLGNLGVMFIVRQRVLAFSETPASSGVIAMGVMKLPTHRFLAP